MKVIHVLNHFLPYQIAGTEVYVWALCKKLQANDCMVSVLIPNYESTESVSYVHDGITVFKYAEPSKPDRALITGQKVSDGLVNFKKHLKDEKPDVVHFHEIAGSNGIAVSHLEAAKAIGLKVVFTMHLANATCKTGNLMYRQKHLCDGKIKVLKCADCTLQKRMDNFIYPYFVLGVSLPFFLANVNPLKWNNSVGTLLSYPSQIKSLKDRLKRIDKACDAIIPITKWYDQILQLNGISAKKLFPVLQALPLDSTIQQKLPAKITLPIQLAFVGRIDELKGIPILIDVLKQFTEKDVIIDIYGTTSNQEFLSNCKKQTENSGNIRWKGKLQQHEVLPTLVQYHALVLPSIFSEMSPLVIQEAFAAGIPIIGSNVYGIAEQVENNVKGLLFTMGSRNSLKEVIKKIIASPDILMELAANISSPRAFNSVAHETKNVYLSVLKK